MKKLIVKAMKDYNYETEVLRAKERIAMLLVGFWVLVVYVLVNIF